MRPFLRPESFAFTDELADVAIPILHEEGVAGLSIGAVAKSLGTSRQALTYRLTKLSSEHEPVSILRQVVAGRFGDRWWQWSTGPAGVRAPRGVPRLAVPETLEEQQGVRAWHAVREMARAAQMAGDPAPASGLSRCRREERTLLRDALERWSGRRLDPSVVTTLAALADGVQLAAADAADPMPADTAAIVLEQQAVALVVRSADEA